MPHKSKEARRAWRIAYRATHPGNPKSKIGEAATKHGLKYSTVLRRMGNGETFKQAVSRPTGRAVAMMARERGLNPSTIYCRLYTGLTLEQALAIPLRTNKSKGAREAALALGYDAEQIRIVVQRVSDCGWALDRALATPFQPRAGSAVGSRIKLSKYTGLPFGVQTRLAAERGIAPSKFTLRLSKGWSLEDALSPRRPWRRQKKVNAALRRRRVGTPANDYRREQIDTFWALVEQGMPITEATITEQVNDTWAALRALMPTTQFGAMKPNYSALARAHGVVPGTFWQRLKSGVPIEQALLPRVINSPQSKIRALGITDKKQVNAIAARMRVLGLTVSEAINYKRKYRAKDPNSFSGQLRARGIDVKARSSALRVKVTAGMSIDEAIAATEANKLGAYCVKQRKHPEIYAAAEATGIKFGTLYGRVRKGLTLAEAVQFKHNRHKPRSNSIAARARAAGIVPHVVYARVLKLGMTLDEAVSFGPRISRRGWRKSETWRQAA